LPSQLTTDLAPKLRPAPSPSDMPEEMHVSFVDSDTAPTGLGEISTPGMMAAVANAFHKLTGKRLYHMPFTPERVLEVLKA
jgi:isoquinoline 1-oxidoreductase subunit beta